MALENPTHSSTNFIKHLKYFDNRMLSEYSLSKYFDNRMLSEYSLSKYLHVVDIHNNQLL
jgi:hypothetical protein